ncbi:phosphotransferase [Streptomyces sp. BPTC-684]|uniref:phosphotransferase n=1 Tax=Streptomyces sp. BPTC-684 TaxID=3043734 RepID=UPI0024B26380|nr:phosphotransferase [Streptomyces sp. BPTC-684]WHM36886.1 phosphotransferase [Streptomyces sp. BPTC-684]
MVNAPFPVPENVFAYVSGRIEQAAHSLWPGATVGLGPHVPSVTGYVRRLDVDDRPMFAKVSLLGSSLVSVLRGTLGDWAAVKAKQDAYSATPGGLLERETIQYGILHTARLRAPRIAGYAGGVLFTEPVVGPTLADLIAKDPYRTAELLTTVTGELGALHRADVTALVTAAAIPERSVHATFARKFNGISGHAYLTLTGNHAPVLAEVVARLRKVRLTGAPAAVVYGDLKPEHIVFPDGSDGRPAFLDPGMSLGHPESDLGKLVSRLVLGLLAAPHQGAGTAAVLGGIGQFADAAGQSMERETRAAWLRQLVVLWLMDTANILTTYLTAPAGLPLPEQARQVIDRAGAVSAMLDRASAALEERADGPAVWRLALGHAGTAAGR